MLVQLGLAWTNNIEHSFIAFSDGYIQYKILYCIITKMEDDSIFAANLALYTWNTDRDECTDITVMAQVI